MQNGKEQRVKDQIKVRVHVFVANLPQLSSVSLRRIPGKRGGGAPWHGEELRTRISSS